MSNMLSNFNPFNEISRFEPLRNLEEFLNNITLIYTEQSFIQSSVWNIVYDRYTLNHGNGTNDYSECYDEVLTILQESQSGEN